VADTRIIDDALIALIGAGDETAAYEAVVGAIGGLLPGAYVIASSLGADNETFRVCAMRGLEKHVDAVRKTLGVDPLARVFRMGDMRPSDLASYRSGRVERVEGGLHTLSLGQFPRLASAAVERLLGVKEIYAIGLAWGDLHYGGITLGLKSGTGLAHAETIETLVHQATIVIRRIRAEAEIHALTDSLEDRVRERTAQLEAAVAELEAFSYSVSHDLRAPLRAINGYATILAEDHAAGLGGDGLRYCTSIVAGTRRMDRLIDDLLAFSRLGRSRLAMEPIDMAAMASSAFGEITTEQQRGGVVLAVGDLAPYTGDPTMLRQVWVNLLANALKFSENAVEPRIEIGCRRGPDDVLYTVRDNGAGFDMEHAGKLFQVFERLHGAQYEGSGIGLAIVRRAVEAHGGRVWAEGAPARGATFFFALPTAHSA